MRTLRQSLAQAGRDMSVSDYVLIVLDSLPDTHATKRNSILTLMELVEGSRWANWWRKWSYSRIRFPNKVV
jgi:hypothetical protein